ncbi:hypothetical protein [Lachnospira multipara]|uniref:Uncharacterized protein n=1 Tax=Lachnospira multipara TaxID=28051 RepID=A0A1H5VH62_9FIRM|nr:hypothetical protein [Lachnospira multipara]SEF85867.1 hypothetical protein SAMN05216537_1116 [Lachnospira multipara]
MTNFSYEKIKDLEGIAGVPILTLDERWYKLIPAKYKTDEINYWEKQVNELLKQQGQAHNDIKEVKKIKNQLIQEVVEAMEDDDNSEAKKKKMEQNQRLIQEAKDKIAKLEDETLDFPKELANANKHLIAETLKVVYERLNNNAEDIELLSKLIDQTRIKLKKNIVIRQDKEEANEKMYTYMHDIFGPDFSNELDKLNGDFKIMGDRKNED